MTPPDFKSLARQRQNRRLTRQTPNWRKQAGGGGGLYEKLREARKAVSNDPKAATRVTALAARAKSFQQNRSALLSPKKDGPTGPRPVVGPYSQKPIRKRKTY